MTSPRPEISSITVRTSQRGCKTFSGCWTCRDRRVKCDEGRPFCRRCTAARVDCQGYDIKLRWKGSSPDNPAAMSSRNSHRSSLPIVRKPIALPLTRAEVAAIQENLHGAQHETSASSVGMFTVFQPMDIGSTNLQSSLSSGVITTVFTTETTRKNAEREPGNLNQYSSNASRNSICHEDECIQTSCSGNSTHFDEESDLMASLFAEDSFESETSPLFSDNRSQSVNSPALAYTRSPSSSNSVDIQCSVDDDTGHGEARMAIIEGSIDPNIPNFDTLTAVLDKPQGLQNSLHLDFLPAPADQKELIHHWVHFLCSAMSPVARIDSPGHNLLTPIALAGITSVFEETSGEIAVFHGICAAAAYSLSQLRDKNGHFQHLATKHRQLALGHLRWSVESKKSANSESIWAAIHTFFVQEGVRGHAEEWRIHLKGLESLILTNLQLIQKSIVARAVYESYLCLSIMGNVHSDVDLKSLLAKIPDLSIVGPMHGISHSILEIVYHINYLSSSTPMPSPTVLDRLELLLHLQSPGNFATEGLDKCSATILLHCAYTYYYATLIHFQRVLRKAAPDTLQDLVETAIGHLEAIESVGNEPKGCIWSWPCLVISAECTLLRLQTRMLGWYASKERHGFVNLLVARRLSTQVWKQRTVNPERPEDVHWQQLTGGGEYDVIPL